MEGLVDRGMRFLAGLGFRMGDGSCRGVVGGRRGLGGGLEGLAERCIVKDVFGYSTLSCQQSK